MLTILCLGLFLPLFGFLSLVLLSSQIGRQRTSILACTTILIAFLCFCILLFRFIKTGMQPETFTLFNWIPIPRIDATFSLHLDSLSLLMSLLVTGISFLIHVYSIGYMEEEEDFVRYFACMNLFVFSMLLLVLANHLLLLFVGWEGVGLASYLLIGFWYTRPAAAQAATKAFVMNRIGDFGFLIGLLLTFYTFGTGEITEISQRVSQEFAIGAPIITLITLLYFIGAIGKSAQLPLYTWLPDAMEGPTPVSALIHAATMVTAGVYLVVRLHLVFVMAPLTLQIVGIVGAVTSIFAALCALGQVDLKRVLAYSTVSQIGLMFLACGTGAFYAAMFHLTTHAFVKALLFLAAGNVLHMTHGLTSMEKMGGLSKKLTQTHWFFLIGVLALSGVPPLAAFFSKDLILEVEYLSGFKTFFYIGFAISVMTAIYLTRAYYLTFKGTTRLEDKLFNSLKEAPLIMLLPLVVLALLSIMGGFLGFDFGKTPVLEKFLADLDLTFAEKEFSKGFHFTYEMGLAIGGALLGVLGTAFIYSRFTNRLGSPILLLQNAFYVNQLYSKMIVLPLKKFSQFIAESVEPKFFDGLLQGIERITLATARELQKFQSGQIRSYFAWMVFGMIFLVAYFSF